MSSSANQDPTSFDFDDDPAISDEFLTSYDNRDQILFAIDCGPAMHKPAPNGKTPVKVAFDCVASVMLNKIFGNTSDRVGVLLYNTDMSNNPVGHEHIYILQDLDIPDAPRVKEAESYGSEGKGDIRKTVGSTTQEIPFGNVFWVCSDMYASNAKQRGSRRVFLITNQDDPHPNNPNLRQAAIRRAKDLYDVGIRIELFGLNSDNHPFDEKIFYNDIFSGAEEIDIGKDEDSLDQRLATGGLSNNVDELLECVRRREPTKRTTFRVSLKITPDLEIGVRGYSTVMEMKRSTPMNVTTAGEQIEEVVTETVYRCQDTQQILLPAEIKSAFDYGGAQVVFSTEELKKMRAIKGPGIQIIGFRKREKITNLYNITTPSFIYPDESQYEGSNRAFTALLIAMLEKDKVGVCAFTPRANSRTTIALMYPQAETFDENGAQDRPPGIYLIRMPYADDLREIPVSQTPSATDEEVDAAVKAIFEGEGGGMEIQSAFNPNVYENPALQLHLATLQSIALDKPVVEKIVDRTKPDTEAIDKRIGQGLKELRGILEAHTSGDREAAVAGQKRKETTGESESEPSRRRVARSSKSVEDHYRDQTLDQCTVPMLKEWLEPNGVKPKRAKADIIAQVCDVLDRRLR